jgi:transcriptional regulator with XRE-family HTH domain
VRRKEVTVLPDGLRQWRKVRGKTQETLGIEADCSPTLIALIESGKRQPSLMVALAIASALDVPLTAFAQVHVDLAALAPENVA